MAQLKSILTKLVRIATGLRQSQTGSPGRRPLRTISSEDLQVILDERRRWTESNGVEGKKADLHESNLRKANLIEANLRGAELYGADLQKALLDNANLQGALLNSANLTEADLRGADLRRASLDRARLHRANLEKADLRGADLTNATGLTKEQIESAIIDKNTRLPEYLKEDVKVKPRPQ